MASFTNPTTYATGDDLAVTDVNAVAQNTLFLYQRPYAAFYGSIATIIPTATPTQVTLGGTTVNGYGFSVTSNNVIVPITGVYSVSFGVQTGGYGGTGAPYLSAILYHNGSEAIGGAVVPSYTTLPASTGTGIVSCTAGDTLGLWALQTSGVNLTTTVAAAVTFVHAYFVGSR
jgi:hypothetical protein